MTDVNKRILIAYHADCMDGFTSAWICRKGLMETAGIEEELIDTISVAYHSIDGFLSFIDDSIRVSDITYDHIYIVDFSVPLDFITSIFSSTLLMA